MAKDEENLIKLTRSNFDLWYFGLQCHLEAKKCAYIITQQESKSKIWTEHQGVGKSYLTRTVNHDDLNYIITCDNVYDMVQKLKRRYHRGLNAYQVNQQFSKLRWTRAEKADQFITSLNRIRNMFSELKLDIDEARFVQKLVDEIPSFLNDLKNDLQRKLNRDEQLDYDETCEEVILTYDQRYKEPEKAMITISTDNKSPKSNNHQKQRSGKWCYYHKTKSHSSDECMKLKKLNENKSTQKSQSTSTTNPDTSICNKTDQQIKQITPINENTKPKSIEIPTVFRANMAIINESDAIYFDTCCTRLMTPKRDHFTTIQDIDNGPLVTTGNGLTKAIAVGTVKVRSFTGEQWIDLTLPEVYLVPNLPHFLFAEPVFGRQGINTQTDVVQGELNLIYKGNVLFTGSRDPDSYDPFKMNIEIIRSPQIAACSIVSQLDHYRTGHCPYTNNQ